MNAPQHGTSAQGRAHAPRSARLAGIWADITNAQHRFAEINRPWVSGPGRTRSSR
jgi:hypothetical protein